MVGMGPKTPLDTKGMFRFRFRSFIAPKECYVVRISIGYGEKMMDNGQSLHSICLTSLELIT